ncbi:MAG: hypothetical protein HYR88_16380 [Verrucomicrobia bacterium]|nr:hypothetical protein [Verrucomicrobiota bacterium]MBI3871135.1 hypothetical protein [Verrucomicrobiota bacterium]
MHLGKLILATLLIFSTGFFAGVLFPHPQPATVQSALRPSGPPTTTPPLPNERRVEALRRFTQNLDLAPEQRERIESHIQESQERTRLLWDLVGPEVQDEFKRLRAQVVSELKPDQRKKFEELSKKYRRERSKSGEASGVSLPPPPTPPPAAPELQ